MPGEVTLQGTSISYVLQAPSGARSGGPAERSQLTLHVYCIGLSAQSIVHLTAQIQIMETRIANFF